MKISIIGSGNMGTGLARLLVAAKHKVTLVSRTPAQVASKVPCVATASYADVARTAEIVFLAVPYDEVKSIASQVGSLAGKIAVDLTNPLAPDFMSLTLGHTSSAGEQVQALFPSAKVVKAFNTVFAQVLAKP
jgi:predicted dinucleotide-binding enzyme